MKELTFVWQSTTLVEVATPVDKTLSATPNGQGMSGKVQVIGRQLDFVFVENAIYRLHFIDAEHLDVTVMADPSYAKGTLKWARKMGPGVKLEKCRSVVIDGASDDDEDETED